MSKTNTIISDITCMKEKFCVAVGKRCSFKNRIGQTIFNAKKPLLFDAEWIIFSLI